MNLAESLLLALHIGDHVAMRGLNTLMSEPYCDGGYVHAGRQHAHCSRMTKDVRRDSLAHQRRMVRLRPLDNRIDSAACPASGQMGYVAPREEVIVSYKALCRHALLYLLGNLGPQREGALLAPFAEDPYLALSGRE